MNEKIIKLSRLFYVYKGDNYCLAKIFGQTIVCDKITNRMLYGKA